MSHPVEFNSKTSIQMKTTPDQSLGKKFWQDENLRYSQPHFRLFKCADILKTLAKGRTCDLLDVGCGPAALAKLLPENFCYYGVDLAIHDKSPNLRETDILKDPLEFEDKKFDFVVASGIFEYMGERQHQKFSEIRNLLKPEGKFIATFINIHHRHPLFSFDIYNNIISIDEFLGDLKTVFYVERYFPTSYNWNGTEPRRRAIMMLNLHLNARIPLISPWLAVEYIFICSLK
jgi:SAM-dependent methyltransferase